MNEAAVVGIDGVNTNTPHQLKGVMSMFSLSFLQGIRQAASDIAAFRRLGVKPKPTHDLRWLDNNDNHRFGFIWYCDILGYDPGYVRTKVVSMSWDKSRQGKVQAPKKQKKASQYYTRESATVALAKITLEAFTTKDMMKAGVFHYAKTFQVLDMIGDTGQREGRLILWGKL